MCVCVCVCVGDRCSLKIYFAWAGDDLFGTNMESNNMMFSRVS